jgi:hypothetical protein
MPQARDSRIPLCGAPPISIPRPTGIPVEYTGRVTATSKSAASKSQDELILILLGIAGLIVGILFILVGLSFVN